MTGGRAVAWALAASSLLALVACDRGAETADLPLASRPAKYTVVYRRGDVSGQSVQWQRVSVVRPFVAEDARFVDRPDPTTPPDGGTLATARGLFSIGAAGPAPLSARPPAPAIGDQQLAVVLRAAVARKLARPMGASEVGGRPCRVYRLAAPPADALRRLPKDDRLEHDDVCIDRAGVVVREAWTHGGNVVFVRTAVSVTLGTAQPTVPPASVRFPASGVAVTPLSPPDTGGAAIRTPIPPAGFRLAATSALTYPPVGGAAPVRSVEWSFENGLDAFTVEAGTTSSAPPWPSIDPARPLQVKGWRNAATVVRVDGSELRGQLADGTWVVVRATRAPGFVAAAARAIAPA